MSKRQMVWGLLICLAVLCPAAVEIRGDDMPAAGGETEEDWVRVGELGPLPERVTDALPLSDQRNAGGWAVYEAMADEFAGNSLDPQKWLPRMTNWLGRQPAYFWPGNVSVGDGKLRLAMKKQEVPEMPKDRGYHTYTSAAVSSTTRVLYGYFEVKARPMNSAGSSSFWFTAGEKDWATEIDVFEIGGKAKGFQRKYNMNVHVFRTPEERRHFSRGAVWMTPWDLAAGEHVYGLEWDEARIRWYVDGVLVRSIRNTHWHQPLNLIFDSETMPDWFGMPADEDLPSVYSVEYVRAWQKKQP